MPYTLNKTDGTILTDLLDNSIDRTTTDLALVGKNTANYGELFNENFIKLLENFASDQEPRSPLKGQLWFDTSEDTLKIYTGNTFIEFARPIVSNTEPSVTNAGDFWFNSNTRQLFFNDGNGLRLAGPIYTAQQGISGFEIATISDITGINHIVAKLKLGNILVGIFSDSTFTPNYSAGEGLKLASENVSGEINRGFTPLNELFEFKITAARSKSLVDNFGNPISVDEFVKVTGQNTIDGRLTVTGANTSQLSDLLNKPLSLGWGPNLTFEMEQPASGAVITPPVRLRMNRADQDFTITTKNGTVFEDAVYIKADENKLGVFTISPATTLDVNGDVTIRGNLLGTNNTELLNVGTTTINFGGDATDIQIGNTSGTTTINNDTVIASNLIVSNPASLSPAVIRSTNSTVNLLNTNTTTINLGSAATTINVGAPSGTVTFNNDVNIVGNIDIAGIFKVDNVRIKDNQVSTTGDFDLELGALFPSRGVNLIDVTRAKEEMFIEKQLTFEGSFLRVSPSFTGPFNLLNNTVQTINFGGETLAINLGNGPSPNANINVLSKLQTYKDLIIGNSSGDPGSIRSSGLITNLFNNTRIINMAQDASDVNVFGDGGAGAFGARQPIRTLTVNATSIILEGDIEVRGGDIGGTVPLASIFNNAQVIEMGNNTSTVILGGPGTNVEVGNRLQVGSTGSVYLQSRVVGGKIRGGLTASTNMDEFELVPEFVSQVYISAGSDEVQLGQGLQSEVYWRTPATAGGIYWSPNENIPDGFDIIGGNPVQRYRTQLPITITRHNHLVRGKLLMSDKAVYYTNALLFMNEWNEVVSTNTLTASDSGNLTVGGSLSVASTISGASGTPALFNNIKVAQVAEFSGNLTSTSVTSKNIFTSNVATLNIGGTSNGVINLGGTTNTTNIPGRLKVGWKTVTGNYDAYAGDRLLIDTTLAGLELRLPPNVTNPTPPIVGDQIQIIDIWKFNVNVVELIRNGNKINGVDANVTLNQAGTAFTLIYTGTERGWCYDYKV